MSEWIHCPKCGTEHENQCACPEPSIRQSDEEGALPNFKPTPSPEVQAMWDKFNATMARMYRENAKAIDELTEHQFCDTVKQMVLCGDIRRHVRVDNQSQQVVYIPFEESERLKTMLADADCRAGAAERNLERYIESERRRELWLKEAKESRGYHHNQSFDVVWKDTCELADKAKKILEKHDKITVMLRRFLVAHRDTAKPWIEAFIETGAITADFEYHPLYPFIKAVLETPGAKDDGS